MAEGGEPPPDDVLKKALDLLQNVRGGRERRFDGKIIVVGHLMAGKTTLIHKLLHKHIDMSKTERTNGIVTMRIGAFLDKKGTLDIAENPKDSQHVLRRMKSAKSQDENLQYPVLYQKVFDLAMEASKKVDISMDLDSAVDTKTNEDGQLCRLYFMDFAGQSVFNSTHQMFMTNRAVYLLVIDISRELDSEVEDDDVYCVGANRRMSVQEFTVFLLSSIHVYSGDQTESFPKVLLIGTHKDKVHEGTAKKRMQSLIARFKDTPLQKHVLDDFIVDCTILKDPNIDQLRQSIFEILKKEPYWGEETPTRWLPLEESIINQRDRGVRVLTLQTIKEMNVQCFVKQEDDEIGKFLQYLNTIGNIIFFGGTNPGVIIILDPQWLIDALKQIITHEQFHQITENLREHWTNFNECAKLHQKLIEAVWSKNEDNTFITHMEQLLIIFEKTDIIAKPLMYNKDGKSEVVDYYFVPSMLKPNKDKDGKAKVKDLFGKCGTKSPSLCFVFDNHFMQPAIFPRIQAECTSIYKIKEVHNEPLMFYQVAVFQLNRKLDLVLEHIGDVIKVTVINEKDQEAGIDSEICENVRIILEDALTNIVKLYGGDTVPFHKALQYTCVKAANNLDVLVTWNELEMSESERVMCTAHKYKRHWMSKTDILGPWIKDRRDKHIASTERTVPSDCRLEFVQLARLARRLPSSDLLLASRTELEEIDLQQSRYDNRDHIVGEVYETLTKWSSRKGFLILKDIHGALMDVGVDKTLDELTKAVADRDTSKYLEEFDQVFLETRVNDEAIDMISQRSAKTYRHLALELGIDHDVIECVVQDTDGVTHRAKRLLNIWRKKSSAKFKEICPAIIETDMGVSLLTDCEQLMMKNTDASEKIKTSKKLLKSALLFACIIRLYLFYC